MLKIPKDAKKFKYEQVPDFEVYIQSTSFNRVLMPDTKFLYEVNSAAKSESCSEHDCEGVRFKLKSVRDFLKSPSEFFQRVN